MVEIEARSVAPRPAAPPSALLSWVVSPNDGRWGGEGRVRVSARLGLSKGHRCFPGGLGVCPRGEKDTRGLSTQPLLPWLALQHAPEREAASSGTARKGENSSLRAVQPNSSVFSLPPRAPLCALSLPSTRTKDAPAGLATPSSQVRPGYLWALTTIEEEPLKGVGLWGVGVRECAGR